MSLSVTVAPCWVSQRARPLPDGRLQDHDARATPVLHHLAQGDPHARHGGEQADQPESLHYLSLAPTQQLKVQVQWGHLEEAFAFGPSEIADLDDYAQKSH